MLDKYSIAVGVTTSLASGQRLPRIGSAHIGEAIGLRRPWLPIVIEQRVAGARLLSAAGGGFRSRAGPPESLPFDHVSALIRYQTRSVRPLHRTPVVVAA